MTVSASAAPSSGVPAIARKADTGSAVPTDDTVAAKFRMRRLRAQQGGMTVYDKARNYALMQLRKQYPGAFDFYRMKYLNEHRRGRSGADPNRKTVDVG